MGTRERWIAVLNINRKTLSLLDELILELDFMEKTRLCILLFANEKGLAVPEFSDDRLRIEVYDVDGYSNELEARRDKIDTAIILSDRRKKSFCDHYTILIARKIEQINPNIHVIVELNESKNIRHLGLTNVADVICIDELNEKLIANSSLFHGFSKLYMHLLYNNTDTNSIFSIPVPDYLIGEKYRYGEKLLSEFRQDMVLIGYIHNQHDKGFIVVNPIKGKAGSELGKDYLFKEGDKLLVIAYENPEIGTRGNRIRLAA